MGHSVRGRIYEGRHLCRSLLFGVTRKATRRGLVDT